MTECALVHSHVFLSGQKYAVNTSVMGNRARLQLACSSVGLAGVTLAACQHKLLTSHEQYDMI